MAITHDHVLTITDLLHRPGASRRVDIDVDMPAGLTLPLVEVRDPLRLAGVIESVVEGLLVRGSLRATVRMSCARCLTAIEDDVHADVVELFADPAAPRDADDDEIEPGYEIDEGTIDLDTLLRDTLVPATPSRPLCREDCRGLCATCGADRNAVACGCEDEVSDPRWAALEGLRLPPHGTDS